MNMQEIPPYNCPIDLYFRSFHTDPSVQYLLAIQFPI